jgi:recombination protein RecA
MKKLDALLKDLEKKYECSPVSATYLKDHVGEYIPTTLSMDIALNGGIREGTITTISAKPAAGKTSFCLTVAVNAQKMDKNVYFVDVEGRLQNELLECFPELDKEKLIVIRSTADKFLTAESYMNIIETILKDDPGCLVILDSIAALCSENEHGEEVKGNTRSIVPKLMYSFYRKIAQIIGPNRSSFIAITHQQANTSGYGAATVEVGGNANAYFASNWLIANKTENLVDDKTKKSYGKNTTFQIKKAASGPPDGTPTIYVRYGKGLDKYEDIIALGTEFGFIERKGAWYNFNNIKELEELKFQGQDALKEFLVKNPDKSDRIEQEIRSMVFGK